MKKLLAILLAAVMLVSLTACGGKTEPDTQDGTDNGQISSDAADTQDGTDEQQVSEMDAESEEFPEGDPAEYSREYWEEKYPGENICPFQIDENGTERSYYWVSGFDGWDGTMESWISQPFNWNGWHKTEDGCIVNEDETLKITDDWANGDESMSSCCTVTTEPYGKDSDDSQSAAGSDDWPIEDYQKPENCEIDEAEDWGSFTKVYVKWGSKDAAKEYKEALALSGGTTADTDGAYEYNSSEVMISYSESNSLANFIIFYN